MGSFCDELDRFQSAVLLEAIQQDKPTVCVCRGMQLLNVVCGGTLYQDLEYIGGTKVKHNQLADKCAASHKVAIEKGNILYEIFGSSTGVNSYHHQSIKDLGKDLKVIAVANDGVIEAVQMTNKNFIIGFQWHPEMMLHKDARYLNVFTKMLEAVNKK